MKRRLFTLAAALSLLLCLATCAGWVRSRTLGDVAWVWVPWAPAGGVSRRVLVHAEMAAGRIKISLSLSTEEKRETLARDGNDIGRTAGWTASPDVQWRQNATSTFWGRRGFGFYASAAEQYATLSVPQVVAALAFLLPPAAWAYGHRRHQTRLRSGLCLACGYDLRATSGRCPECGTTFGAST